MEKCRVLYRGMIEDDELMEELEEIINYSAGKMRATIQDGSEIYEFIENKLSISPVGIIPLKNIEGYFFLCEGHAKNTWVYQYRLSIFEKHDEKYRSIKTQFVDVWQRTIANSYENIKSELIRMKTELPNPAVYSIETELSYPLEETLLPVAKRCLVRYFTVKS